MLFIYGAISVGLIANYSAVRTAARWFVWSHDYKAQVLAQPASAKGDLKHMDWDGWGMFAQNTYVFRFRPDRFAFGGSYDSSTQ
jgi:hypothetical protein